MTINLLLHTDVYKMGHMEQYNPEVEYIQSHMVARSNHMYDKVTFFGLMYYIKTYVNTTVTEENVREFLEIRKQILGSDASEDVKTKLNLLVGRSSLPIKIHAVKEFEQYDIGEPLIVVENTEPGFHWLVGMLESLLLKVWNTCTVATFSKKYLDLFTKYAVETGSPEWLIPYQVHDFGYRGCSSEETAALSGAAHLVNFKGTDTVVAVKLMKDIYGITTGASVPASEHSVMCSFGKDLEIEAFKNMLRLYPTGIVSIVSDTYNLYNVLENFTVELKEQILQRDGKVVFRPDSGNPVDMIIYTIQHLDYVFGSTVNAMGYKELNPKVGTIYGDGMYFDRAEEVLSKLKNLGYASSNLVIGVGGILLQSHSRDDLGFAFKANNAILKDGREMPIFKDPITDSKKKSIKGRISTENMIQYY